MRRWSWDLGERRSAFCSQRLGGLLQCVTTLKGKFSASQGYSVARGLCTCEEGKQSFLENNDISPFRSSRPLTHSVVTDLWSHSQRSFFIRVSFFRHPVSYTLLFFSCLFCFVPFFPSFFFECVYCTSTICEGVRERQDEDTMTDSESNQNYYSLRSFTSSLGDSDDIQKTGGVYFYPCWWVSLWLTSYALFFTRTSWPFLDFVLQEAFHKQAEVWSGESGRIRENIVFSSPA